MTAVSVASVNTVSPIYFKDLDRVKVTTRSTSAQAEFLCRLVHLFKTASVIRFGQKSLITTREELAEDSYLSDSTIGRYLKKFEQLGYIIKRRTMGARPQLLITLTDKLSTLLSLFRTKNNLNSTQQEEAANEAKSLNLLQTVKMTVGRNDENTPTDQIDPKSLILFQTVNLTACKSDIQNQQNPNPSQPLPPLASEGINAPARADLYNIYNTTNLSTSTEQELRSEPAIQKKANNKKNNFSSNTNITEPTQDTAPDFIAPTPLTHERNQVLTDYTEYEQYTAKERANKNKIFSSNTETTKPDNESACNAKKNDDINRGGIKPTLSDYEEYERFTELSDQESTNKIANKPNNTQQNKKTENTFSSNTKQSQKRHQTKRVSDFIGKALTNVQEKYIASTVRNLGLKTEITKPQQLIDEMKEAALNPKRFSKAKNFKHKINTMAKCIRVGRWRDAVNFEDEHVQNDDTFNPARISVDATTGALTIDAEQSKPKSKYSADDFTQEEEAFWQEIEAKARAKRIERNKL